MTHAEKELEILVKSHTDPENRPIIEEFIPEILELVKKFNKSGQSGGSAPFTARALSQAIEHLCLQEPICPITGIEEEWVDVSVISDEPIGTLYQNNRCSALFKEVRKGKKDEVHYVDAIVKRTQNGTCWSGGFWLRKEDYLTSNKNLKISNSQCIKEFPFTPKTFYIDVIEEEVAPDDWEMYVKDIKQLEDVFEYYKPTHPYFTRKKKLERILNEI